MKKLTMNKILLSCVLGMTTVLFAQQGEMQQSTDRIEARPHGGFSKSITGKWNCGKFGTLTLTDTKGKVNGTFTYNSGSVTGTVKGNTFAGDWREAKSGYKGHFSFEVSTRRMTPKPTHLEGTRTKAAMGAKAEKWVCTK